MSSEPCIFDWLDRVRERPVMYARSITELESQVWGYYSALRIHNIVESAPNMTNKFLNWASDATHWSGFSYGWGSAFDKNTPPDEDRFEYFFKYVEQFRVLKPTLMACVTLKPEHRPTGKLVTRGVNGLIDRPDEIIIINYAPTLLHHLRYRYGNRFEDDWFLYCGNLLERPGSQVDLFDWVADEFGIEHSEWQVLVQQAV